ncbi:hypothetical protein VTJ83DRAFT_5274 [Remersonia thermophila]|uniref:Uncharacterized protein n=1 Tax=Remersonia thermophila TaxID=72144 RepID=A0ABR4D8K4_9PEZI
MMDTIHETVYGRPDGLSGTASEAVMISAVRPSQLRSTEALMAAIDNMAGRSISLKVAPKKKPSLRGWVKRSNTSRTIRTTGFEATNSQLKGHIKHLGGGRIEEARVKGTATNMTLLAPAPMRPLRSRSRPGSTDSRVTQWLDFYSLPAAGHRQPDSPSQPPTMTITSQGSSPARRLGRKDSNGNLRPAPLRVPSSEQEKAATTSPPQPFTRALERKNSKWKPLPSLPVQQSSKSRQPTAASPAPPSAGSTGTTRKRQPKETLQIAVTNSRQHSPAAWGAGDQWLLSALTFGSPPPTPDSDAGGAARAQGEVRRAKAEAHEGRERERSPRPKKAATSPLDAFVGKEAQTKDEAEHQVQHTREERIWLHANYRGEAPFLEAWGLDITKLSHRLQGLELVRELMIAESRKGEARDLGNVV